MKTICAICAVFGPKSKHQIRRICANLTPYKYGGNEDFFMGRYVALGHKATKIGNIQIPHQPPANEDKTIWISARGAIKGL